MKLYENISRFFRTRETEADKCGGLPDGIISHDEALALRDSYGLYLDTGGINIAASIASELASISVTEFSFSAEGGKNELCRCLSSLNGSIKKYVEYACAVGGVIFKPVYDGKDLGIETFLPFDFIPLGTDAGGRINECAFIYRISRGGKNYVRIEEHRKTENGYTVTNRAFEGENAPCELSAVKEWEKLSTKVEIYSLSSPLFAYFGMPFGNPSFPSSPLGAPVFRRAEKLIKEADKQFHRLVWEFEGGELAIDASEDAFRIGKDGKPRLPEGKERLYRTNALDACCSSNELLKTFAPELRDKSIINGLNRIIMLIEDACGIARGTFSDPSEIARTATEVRSMRQRTYTTVSGIRHSLENALYDLFDAVTALCGLYSLNVGTPSFKIKIGDGVLSDSDSLRDAWREDLKAGIISADEFKARWY